MKKLADEFCQSEKGAVTVDWVVLAATMVFFVLTIVLGTIKGATGNLANSISERMDNLL